MKKSRTALNIDRINRQLDRITSEFGADSLEVSNYIVNNRLETLDLYRTKSGAVHIKNTKANRKFYQKIAAVAKKPVKVFIAKSKQAYKPPRVKKSPIPKVMPDKPTKPQYKAAARLLATLAEIKEYIYENYSQLDYNQRSTLAMASYRKAPRPDNMPQVVDETYQELYKEFFDAEITEDFDSADPFDNPDIYNTGFSNSDFGF